ncbi:class I mannose-6-phosphate isomerase [Novosphingobium sp. YJ-S2-02]|uniref:Class I mannose-6-phosphate isomerase n=1 Tax=Novosphingobium aureum TaxID=2792964 RepID=A0A931MKW9_9SPHN|nr:class I mannose-6-phosphate isomerase [Novosphingobium aureum]MBH0112436.1 class I mannose-6-phosphate isomerase [Novosphingobium aureum]
MSAALPVSLVEKPWGRDQLPAPFEGLADRRIGEIWFEPPAMLPQLLVKYIFTSEKLSVQVHPSDAQTLQMGIGRQGKEECWLILDAEPGAKLGIGFEEEISSQDLRAAALDGSIEQLLSWHTVNAGDFFYIPANTVHAIGGGVSLIEVQQNSDITYRLFDYGRPRRLHLDESIAVASARPYAAQALRKRVSDHGSQVLVDGPLFRLEQVAGVPDREVQARFPGALLVIPRSGSFLIDGDTICVGQCAVASCIDAITFSESGVCLLAAALN